MIEGRHPCAPKTLSGSDDRSVDGSEREVAIPVNQLGDAQPVPGRHRLDDEVPGGKIAQEPDFRSRAQPRADQIGRLGHDERRHYERFGMVSEELQRRVVIAVVRVDIGVQRAGVDQKNYGATSAARISSMRSEMSSRPLRPAPAARNR